MFIKVKYLAEGTFDKLRAHLVAGDDQQDKLLHVGSKSKVHWVMLNETPN